MDPIFSFASRLDSGTTWIALAGELDRQAVHDHGPELRELLGDRGEVVLDTRGIDFIDLQGARLLIELDRRVRERGARMRLLASRVARNLLELVGASDLLAALDETELGAELDQPATIGEPPVAEWEAALADERAQALGRAQQRALGRGVDAAAFRARLDARLSRYTDLQLRAIRTALGDDPSAPAGDDPSAPAGDEPSAPQTLRALVEREFERRAELSAKTASLLGRSRRVIAESQALVGEAEAAQARRRPLAR